MWRGSLLEADANKLPKTRKDAETYPCDTILDYNVDWQYIVENNLDSPHLFWLHNGSVPPVRSLNFIREKVNQVKLKFFRDDSGLGHYGQTAGGKPKIVRFDAPNIVRHGGVSSFSEGMLLVYYMFEVCPELWLSNSHISSFHHATQSFTLFQLLLGKLVYY